MFILRSLTITPSRVIATRTMATKSVFVGNLPFRLTEEDLREHFNNFRVESVRIPTDMEGRSKGFGFAELDEADVDQAVGTLNGSTLNGRTIRVSIAEQKERGFGGNERNKRVYGGDRDDSEDRGWQNRGTSGYNEDRGGYSRGRGGYGGGKGGSDGWGNSYDGNNDRNGYRGNRGRKDWERS